MIKVLVEAALVRQFTRVRLEGDAHVVEVERYEWRPQHCMPVAEWYEAMRLPLSAGARALARAQRALLADAEWFATCARCGDRKPNGYWFNGVCSCTRVVAALPRACARRLSKADKGIMGFFTRVRPDAGAYVVEVGTIEWMQPHRARLAWVEAERLPPTATRRELEQAQKALLEDERYFVRCGRCKVLKAKGHTSGGTCHTCLTRTGGVSLNRSRAARVASA